jgi:hypothetical protein
MLCSDGSGALIDRLEKQCLALLVKLVKEFVVNAMSTGNPTLLFPSVVRGTLPRYVGVASGRSCWR